jgi:hypothetical protein
MKLIELSSAKLNNTGDSVTVFDNAGNVIDTMTYTSSELARAWMRDLATGQWSLSEPGFYPTIPSPQPTPASSPTPQPSANPTASPQPQQSPSPSPSATPIATPTPLPSATPTPSVSSYAPDISELKITAINPCPVSGELESLTIYYAGSQPAVLTNWSILDQSDNAKQLSLSLAPYSTFTWSWSGSLLNNSGDTVALRSSLGQTQLPITIPACPESGAILYSTNQGWQWSSELNSETPTSVQTTTTAASAPGLVGYSTAPLVDPLLNSWVNAGDPLETYCDSTQLDCSNGGVAGSSAQIAPDPLLTAAYQQLPLPTMSLQPSTTPPTIDLPSAQPPPFLAGLLFLTSGSSFSLGGLVGMWREIRYNRT